MSSTYVTSPKECLYSFRSPNCLQRSPILEVLSQFKKMTSLKGTLSQPRNYTLLVSTNTAFEQLPTVFIIALKNPENDILMTTKILFHIKI